MSQKGWMIMGSSQFTATEPLFRADHDIFRIIGSDKEVTVFARMRYPFEPKEPWQKEYRKMLQTALSFLSAGKDEIIWAAYGAVKNDFYDLENVLFYNIGTGWFRQSSVNGFYFTGHSPEEILLMQEKYGIPKEFSHWFTYRLQKAELSLPQRKGNSIAAWKPIPISPVTTSLRPLDYWRWVKKNLSAFKIAQGQYQGPFSFHLILDSPKTGGLNTTSVAKCLLDGIICAFHSATAAMCLPDLCRQLNCPADWLENIQTAPLGKREYIRPYRRNSFAWNPADDKCRECSLQVRYNSDEWRLGGSISASENK